MTSHRRLIVAMAALPVLQIVHGAVPGSAGQVEKAFGKVIGTTGTVLGLVALTAVLLHWAPARRLALVASAAIPLAFVLYHAVPIAGPVTQPYWGDGSASSAQWLTVLMVIAAGVWGFLEARGTAEAPVSSGARSGSPSHAGGSRSAGSR